MVALMDQTPTNVPRRPISSYKPKESDIINKSDTDKVIEPVLMTTSCGVFGAVSGRIIGMVIFPLARRIPRDLAASLSRIQYARVWARQYSSCIAALWGIDSAMSGIRGKDDDITNKIASGAGLAFSFGSQGLKGQRAHALSRAAVFAAVTGTVYKVKEKNRLRDAQEALYTETRAMLSKLGLEEYEKNFKKAHLTDPTLPFLTDSDLQEVNIPLGARLLILDHIKRTIR